ncbi:MAG: hypothetical protein CME65_04680 [Halobacteriovoraceae bacterium]|nr:hypothetical protein [Halobacteriovoraceae bacterium]|tara:strand:+ start:1383 stop:2828 length:1446 start_codon:yes stop_codon:yes gene_type:complete
MKRNLALCTSLLAYSLTTSVFAFDYIKGSLIKTTSGFAIEHAAGVTPINASERVLNSLPSLESPSFVTQSNGKKYSFEFKGEFNGQQFNLSEVPTNIAGPENITGILEYNLIENSYSISGRPVKYGYTKVLNGYSFDEISKRHLIGTEIEAEGHTDENGIFVINAIMPKGLFSAEISRDLPPSVQSKLEEEDAWSFYLNTLFKNEFSQAPTAFRHTVIDSPQDPVKPGDSFIVFTLGGRQGDTFGSVNGHFAAGLGRVNPDMSLRGEISNGYVTNGKDILSGNTNFMNYFSHLVQGQNVYRPTYTIIAYGVDSNKLKDFRDSLEESHILFRTQELEITPEFNCTTEAIKALRAVGIKGNYKRLDNIFKGIISSPLYLIGGQARTLNYSLRNDAAKFQPRPAYKSFLGVVLRDDLREKLGAKRVDIVFYPQIPSQRPVGGAALDNLFGALHYLDLYKEHEVENQLSPEDLRPLLAPELDKIE